MGRQKKNPVYCLLKKSGHLNQIPEMGKETFYSNKGHKLDANFARCAYEAGEEIIRYRGSNTGRISKIKWDGSFSVAPPHNEPLPTHTESASQEKARQYPVCVICENGEEILADHVIVIDKLCFGNIAKIFLEYEEAFWENDVGSISLIYEDDTPASVSTNKMQWLKYVQSFSVPRPKERLMFGHILIGWCPADIADLVETMTDGELSTAITDHLKMFFGRSNIPQPKSILCTKWRSNKFIKGSYAFLPVGVDGQVMDTLAQPLVGSRHPDQILFAGEATMKTLYGTVQGALLSGHREADRLAAHYKKTVAPTSTTSLDKQV
uniref:Polyamine oxidase (exo-N4-amino) 1 n=1 Tax=Sinocyclocheilus grahami TaxID=75366 RepID=A0A672PLS7_SINGR